MDANIIITILIGLVGLYLTYLLYVKSFYPGRLTLFIDSKLPLFYALIENFKDVEITYKKNPVSKQLVWVKYYLCNTGKKDINSQMTEKPISIEFPENIKFKIKYKNKGYV